MDGKESNADLMGALAEMRGGEVWNDIHRKFNEVLTAVLNTRAKGQLTLTLNIMPSKVAMGGAVVEVAMDHAIKMKKPELEIGNGHFFVTEEGKLSRDDPNQAKMFELEAEKEKRGRSN